MGSSHADGRDESFERWNLPANFVTLWEQRWGIFSQYGDSWWNMGASLWTQNHQSKQYHHKSSPVKKIKKPSLGRKSHDYSFLGCRWCYTHWLPWTTINSERYIATLKTLKQSLRRVWKQTKIILLQHDNARPHTLWTTTEAIEKLDLTILPHLPYSSDLAPCNFHNFCKNEGRSSWTSVWLKWRGGEDCQDLDEETKFGVLLWLVHCWQKCVWRMVVIMWRSKCK